MRSSLQSLAIVVLVIALALLVVPAQSGAADDKPDATTRADVMSAPVAFDIRAQPLEDALYSFGATTGIEVVTDGGSIAGRRSSRLSGTFAPTEALRLLLAGTGLEARTIGARAITLSPVTQETAETRRYRGYSATLQNAVLNELCRESRGLGTYRIAALLWIDADGRARRVELLSSTGDQARDGRIYDLLRSVSAGRPPPELPQPIVMVILPRPATVSGDCAVEPSQPTPVGVRRP